MAVARRKQDEHAAPARKAYDRDFYGWALEQGALLRAGRLDEVDLENVAEEIESLGRGEFDKLVSFTRLVLLHMLKWEHQPNLRSRSWALSIENHRNHARDVLDENSSVKPRIEDALARGYRSARLEAMRETGLAGSVFPKTSPFTWDEVLAKPFPDED